MKKQRTPRERRIEYQARIEEQQRCVRAVWAIWNKLPVDTHVALRNQILHAILYPLPTRKRMANPRSKP